MKKRLEFACWNPDCQERYTLFREVKEGAKIKVECPFCEEEGVADLGPYRTTVVEVYQSQGTPEHGENAYNLPDVLPTQPIPEAEK